MNMLALLNPADEPMVEIRRPATGGLVVTTQGDTTYAARSLMMLGTKDEETKASSPDRMLHLETSAHSPVLLATHTPKFHMSPLASKVATPSPTWTSSGIVPPGNGFSEAVSAHAVQPPLKRRLPSIGSVPSEIEMFEATYRSSNLSPDVRPDYCSVTGCLRRPSQLNQGKCAVHKGMKLCQIDGCFRPVQSRGCCKSHGGGARCKYPDCAKGAISKGRCRTHGGGTRCAVPECVKWAQRFGCCVRHSKAITPKSHLL